MKRRLGSFIVSLALLSALQYVRVCPFKTNASNEMRIHNLDTGLSYTTIQDAIDATETLSGHTIFVEEGTYHENLHMNKSLSLIGEDREKTVVDGNGRTINDYVLLINRTSNVVVKGFTFQNCHIGAFLLLCNLSRISDNQIINCSWFGMWVYDSSNNFIDGNVLKTNNVGIFLSAPPNFLTANNILFGNSFCNNLEAGIRVYWVSNNSISANWIDGNPKGIELSQGDKNFVEANTFKDNKAGTYLTESNDNTFLHNNYIDNTENVVVNPLWDPSSNNWGDSYPLGGNYWSNHNRTDFFSGPYQDEAGPDGIADTSYVIDEENEDDYPLMTPFVSQGISVGLFERDFQLQTDYADLSYAHDRLLWNFTQLHINCRNLQEASDNLSATHKATLYELDRLRNLAYALTVMTTILAGATTVLAIVAYRRRHIHKRTD